jgi:crotonobetainyl-CoA:carnitine CoA-transferase CaiB-like acyl-CoA transferase
MEKPLEGVRVLEFTNAVAGPVAGFVLADLGAEVIKVEPTHRGNPAVVGPLVPGAPDRPYNRVPMFNELNRGKVGLPLDVARPEGRELFLRLTALCDIVLENFSPRALEGLRLEYEDLRQARPDIIVVSMPAFGRTGAYRDRRSYGPGVDAMSGLCHLTGYRGAGRPMKPGNFFCDYNAGLLAAFSAMAALWHRRLTGEGQFLECALLDSELPLVGDALLDAFFNGRPGAPLGNRHPWMAPHGVYPCRGEDAWLAIACPSDAAFQALCQAMGRPELAQDPRFRTLTERYRHQDELDEEIAAWTRERDAYEAMHLLQEAGVPAAPVLDAGQLHRDPQYAARGYFVPVRHPEMGTAPVPGLAFRYQEMAATPAGPAPRFGEHIDYVLGDLLGLAREEIEALESSGVVARQPRLPGAPSAV